MFWSAISTIFPGLSSSAKATNDTEINAFIRGLPTRKSISITSGVPSKLYIPKIDFERDILPGEYNPINNKWDLSDDGIHFAHPSNLANDNSGYTLIYGHNNDYVFGELQQLKNGNTVTLITSNSYEFKYSFYKKEKYNPKNTQIFGYSGPPELVLQTCTGSWNESRELYFFKLEKVTKI